MRHLQLLSLLALFAFNASAQNVGIGTLTPSDQLHTTGTVRFEKYKAPTTRMMQIDSSGRLVVTAAGAVASNTTAQAMADNGCAAGNGITSTIVVSGQATAVPSSRIAVRVNITHTFDGDLKIFLIPPGGGFVLALANNAGSSGDNFTNTIFTDQALTSVMAGTAPFTGQYRPSGNTTGCLLTGTVLGTFAGIGGGNIVPDGTWTLKVFDNAGGDIGTLNNWSISFTGPESITTADENNYIPKFSAGNLVASNIYQSAGNSNIGIGTVNPTAKLEVNGTMKITNGSQGLGKVLTSDAAGLASWSPLPVTPSYWAASGADIYNSNTGNVGIGNTNPRAPLSFASALGNKIALWGNADGTHYGIGVAGGGLQLYADGPGSDVLFGHGSSNSFTEKMRVKGNGNVGIGTNNPTATLDVVRGTGTNGTARFYGTTYASHFNYDVGEETFIRGGKVSSEVSINDLGTGNVKIAVAGGNVGIGTNNPGFKLEVFSPGFGILQNDGTVAVGSYIDATGGWLGTTTNHSLNLFTNNTQQARLTTDGNFGIGITNPTATLDVVRGTGTNGTARFRGSQYASHFNYAGGEQTYIRGGLAASDVYINDQGTGNIRIADAGGNVGIGLVNGTNPTAKLHVNGTMKITDGSEGDKKVLTSDAAGNATWQSAAYGNTRFMFLCNRYNFNPTTKFTQYNFGTTTSVILGNALVITINKAGLYHFDFHSFSEVDAGGVGGGEMIINSGTNNILNSQSHKHDTPVNRTASSGDKSLDMYLGGSETLEFRFPGYYVSGVFCRSSFTVSGHLIAE